MFQGRNGTIRRLLDLFYVLRIWMSLQASIVDGMLFSDDLVFCDDRAYMACAHWCT